MAGGSPGENDQNPRGPGLASAQGLPRLYPGLCYLCPGLLGALPSTVPPSKVQEELLLALWVFVEGSRGWPPTRRADSRDVRRPF